MAMRERSTGAYRHAGRATSYVDYYSHRTMAAEWRANQASFEGAL
jgi:hypothetical protein